MTLRVSVRSMLSSLPAQRTACGSSSAVARNVDSAGASFGRMAPSAAPAPFGRDVMKAMVCDKPVIASVRGAPADILMHEQPNALVQADTRPMDNAQRRNAWGTSGRRRLAACFW